MSLVSVQEYYLEGHSKGVLSLCVGAGNFLFSGALDSTVRVRNPRTPTFTI